MEKELQQVRSQLWHRERTPSLKSRSDRRKEDDQELWERKMKENPAATLGMGALTHSFSPESFDLNLGLKSAFTRYRQADEGHISSLLLECFFFKILSHYLGLLRSCSFPVAFSGSNWARASTARNEVLITRSIVHLSKDS